MADFLILDDLRTLSNPQASLLAKGFALASFFPVGKVIKDAKLLTKVAGKSDTMLRHLANKGLNEAQIKSYKRFVNKIPQADSNKQEILVYDLPKGGKAFERIKPNNAPGSFEHWEKYIDQTGRTKIPGHRTYDPKGQFVHWHEKLPFDALELKKEPDYITRINQTISIFEL